MADLIVVCHNVVFLFSDKCVKFDQTIDLNVAWQRWYNRAILHSVKQLHKAGNWIQKHPDRIFSDAACGNRLELFQHVSQPLEIHLIAVANGAARACIRYFGGGSGSLVVCPDQNPRTPAPFQVGNPAQGRAFVHVLDEINLNVVLQELDTVGDFRAYLNARRNAFESGALAHSPSEEDLLAIYQRDLNELGEHDFVSESGKSFQEGERFAVKEGSYLSYTQKPEYRRKKKADKISYLWDALIETFAKNYVDGTLAPLPDDMADIDGRHGGAEIGLRFMALERRVYRRAHAEAIRGAFDTIGKSAADRFFRAMLPELDEQDKTGFFILLVKRQGTLADLSYDDYRKLRARFCHAYSQNLLERQRDLKRVVGIATDGERTSGRSEDLIYQEAPEWTDEVLGETKKLADIFEVFKNANPRKFSITEYPETDLGLHGSFKPVPYRFFERSSSMMGEPSMGNRAQRRARKSRSRRTRPKRR